MSIKLINISSVQNSFEHRHQEEVKENGWSHRESRTVRNIPERLLSVIGIQIWLNYEVPESVGRHSVDSSHNLYNLSCVHAGQAFLWNFAVLDGAFAAGGVGDESNAGLVHVVHRVITLVDGEAHQEEVHLRSHHHYEACATVSILTNI